MADKNIAAELGSIGDVTFETSSMKIRTFQQITSASEAKYTDHEVINQKPVSEFTGLELDEKEIQITLDGSLGVDPLEEVKKLREMRDSGEPYRVILFGEICGDYTVRSIDEEYKHTIKNRPLIIKLTLSIKEHITTVPSEAQMKMREEELKRTDTGIGGPRRLPGSAEPQQDRDLEPAIDPVTRMPI
jgi:phage protein U